MKADEANKIISEFMGATVHQWGSFDGGNFCWTGIIPASSNLVTFCKNWGTNTECFLPRFDLSLDALVPVWEKLDYSQFVHGMKELKLNRFAICIESKWFYGPKEVTIQEAAAIATAKAIKELN